VLDSDDLKVQQNSPEGPFFAMAKVRENTKPGNLSDLLHLRRDETVGPLRRRWRSAGTRGREAGQARQEAGKQVEKVPVGAPQTGGGGTAELAGMAKSEAVSVDIPRIGAQSTH
jgi:hypothetical protein